MTGASGGILQTEDKGSLRPSLQPKPPESKLHLTRLQGLFTGGFLISDHDVQERFPSVRFPID